MHRPSRPGSSVTRTTTLALTGALLAIFSTAVLAAVYDGASGDGNFTGTPGTDRAAMRAGNYTATGLGKADFLFDNSGDDELYGGAGSDFLNGVIDSDNASHNTQAGNCEEINQY